MKIVFHIARTLLGLLFLVFGLNGFLHFIPIPPPAGPIAAQFMGALFLSHYLIVVSFLEIVGGALLLVNRFVSLGLILLGPILVNIILFHTLMAPEGLPLAGVATILWFAVFASRYKAFLSVLAAEA